MQTQPGTNRYYIIGVATVAALGGFLFGYDLVLMSGANIFLREQFSLSDVAFGFTTKSAHIGCILGPFLGIWFTERIGRKRTLLFSSLLLAVSAVVTAIAPDIISFNIFRIVGGVGVGLGSVASPMYLAEITPARSRGALGLMYQFAVVTGCIMAAVAAYFLVKYLSDQVSWRWMFFSEMVAILPFFVLVLLVPRSPRWLAQRGLNEEALDVLAKVLGPQGAATEMTSIQKSLQKEEGGWAELWQRGFRKALLIAILLGLFNNLTGWSIISSYLPALFIKGGFSETTDAIFRFVLVYGFMGILTLVSIALVDRVGRRPLWNWNALLMAVALCLTAYVFHYNVTGTSVFLAISLCVIPHALALGGLPWLMMSELFPTRIRSKAVAVSTTFLWIANFGGGFIFPIITGYSERTFGTIGPSFLLFAAICLLALLFGLTLLPETKQRTLEDIANSWKK